jgi:hypothetical protein
MNAKSSKGLERDGGSGKHRGFFWREGRKNDK